MKTNEELLKLVNDFKHRSISDASRRAYASDWRSFLDFCAFRKLDPLPATSETITMFLSALADEHRAVSTIVRILTSINKAHELAGFESVRTRAVKDTMKGIKRSLGSRPEQVRALMYSDIQKLASLCDSTILGIRDKSLLLLGWCSALRRSEIVDLDIGDLEFSEKGIVITIRHSKTDQEGHGRQIAIPLSSDEYCPVGAVKKWIERLPTEEQLPDKPLFRAIGAGGKRKWFSGVNGRLSDRMVSKIVKRYARLAGFPESMYSSHSLRRGLATEAGARQVPERIIARHTRHVSFTVLRQYIEAGNIWDECPLSAIYSPLRAPSSSLK